MKKIIIGIIIGIMLMLGVNFVGASISSTGVLYNSKTLNTVLDDLYSKIEEINNTGDASASDILIGKTALVKGIKVTGTIQDRGTIQDTGGLGCFPRGCDSGDSQYYSFNNIPEGYYHKDGYSWAPEIRVNANKFRSALGISADKIASGQSIAGITGTYTSDANASASNILSGKTAYVNGSKITGSMANKSGTTTAATTITESGSNALITIPTNGYYSTNSKISVPIETIKNEVSTLGTIYYLGSVNNGSTLNVKSKLPVDYINLTVENFIVMPTAIGWAQGRSEQGSSSGKWNISYNSTTGILSVDAAYGVPSSDGGGTHGIAYTSGNKVYCVIGNIKSL